MGEICERSERATENKKSVSEEISNFLDVGTPVHFQKLCHYNIKFKSDNSYEALDGKDKINGTMS